MLSAFSLALHCLDCTVLTSVLICCISIMHNEHATLSDAALRCKCRVRRVHNLAPARAGAPPPKSSFRVSDQCEGLILQARPRRFHLRSKTSAAQTAPPPRQRPPYSAHAVVLHIQVKRGAEVVCTHAQSRGSRQEPVARFQRGRPDGIVVGDPSPPWSIFTHVLHESTRSCSILTSPVSRLYSRPPSSLDHIPHPFLPLRLFWSLHQPLSTSPTASRSATMPDEVRLTL